MGRRRSADDLVHHVLHLRVPLAGRDEHRQEVGGTAVRLGLLVAAEQEQQVVLEVAGVGGGVLDARSTRAARRSSPPCVPKWR